MLKVMDIVSQPGLHGVIFGERGVGKTSIAVVIAKLLQFRGSVTVRVACDSGDDFDTIWDKVARKLRVERQMFLNMPDTGDGEDVVPERLTRALDIAEGFLGQSTVDPGRVCDALMVIASNFSILVVIDELDRLESTQARAGLADLVKMLSDETVDATLLLVGVADDVGSLIGLHPSTERALGQVHMPRMRVEELDQILTQGLENAELTIDGEALQTITHLSNGLPSYTHLLGLWAGRNALTVGVERVGPDQVAYAIDEVLKGAHQSVLEAYVSATASNRETNFRDLLLACALAPRDDLGFFSASDLAAPMSKIKGTRYDVPRFAGTLAKLTLPERGEVLEKKGAPRRFRYRLRNPLLQPYLLMRGMKDGLLAQADLQASRD